jgi:hypothetical protein
VVGGFQNEVAAELELTEDFFLGVAENLRDDFVCFTVNTVKEISKGATFLAEPGVAVPPGATFEANSSAECCVWVEADTIFF